MSNDCEIIKCSDYKNGKCLHRGKYCKYDLDEKDILICREYDELKSRISELEQEVKKWKLKCCDNEDYEIKLEKEVERLRKLLNLREKENLKLREQAEETALKGE